MITKNDLLKNNEINKSNYFCKEQINFREEQTHGSVPTIDHNIFGNVDLLGRTIQWFKTMTTNEYIKNVKQNNWPRFSKRLWQSRFHDRIIRNEKELWVKRIYIENNPKNWEKDKENRKNNLEMCI